MKNISVRRGLISALLILGFSWSASSHAVVTQIDKFVVNKNGADVFTDDFTNNLTPSQEPGIYFGLGTYPNGAESGGRLTLNSGWGATAPNAVGQPFQVLLSVLQTNVDPANKPAGLTQSSTLAVNGTFDLSIPAGPAVSTYGVRFIDAVIGQPADRLVQMVVQYFPDIGGPAIRYFLQDYENSSITTLGFVPLNPPTGADQIELRISRPNASNNDFFGAYAFGSGGVFEPFVEFQTPGALFTNTEFVRAQFIVAAAVVPEPAMSTLFFLGLAGLAVARRRGH